MKAAFCLLCLIATMNFAFAFAGPPPFTNGSPLITGTDGTYQATASGVNFTGVFSFVIKGGLQTSTSSAVINSWVFFIDGDIVQGQVVAAIDREHVVGVLSGGAAGGAARSLATGSNGAVTLPAAFIVPGNAASGEFRGSISLNNPYGSFRGSGTLKGAPTRTDQLIVITEPQSSVVSSGGAIVPGTGNSNVTVTTD